MLFLDKSPEKSLTVILETIFWIMPTFSCSIELVELRRLLNIDESKLLVGLNNLKLIKPIILEIMAVVEKTIIVITKILTRFF